MNRIGNHPDEVFKEDNKEYHIRKIRELHKEIKSREKKIKEHQEAIRPVKDQKTDHKPGPKTLKNPISLVKKKSSDLHKYTKKKIADKVIP